MFILSQHLTLLSYIIQMLLGGGGSFSAGGPGKGMYSRLCKLSRCIQSFLVL